MSNYPKTLGFQKEGYVWVCGGRLKENEGWLNESEARFNTLFGWFFAESEQQPQTPEGISVYKLYQNQVFDRDDTLLPKSQIFESIAQLVNSDYISNHIGCNSEYHGQIGDRIRDSYFTVFCIETLDEDMRYPKTCYSLSDDRNNVYFWITSAKKNWEVQQIVKLSATVKAHDTYKGIKYTYLERCLERK